MPVASKDRRAVFTTIDELLEAPNWTPDGLSLIYNSKGRLFRIPVAGGAPHVIDTGFAVRCNNDHGISPDGKTLVISDQSEDDGKSRMYLTNIGVSHFYRKEEFNDLLKGFSVIDPCEATYYIPKSEAQKRGYSDYLQSMWIVYAIK